MFWQELSPATWSLQGEGSVNASNPVEPRGKFGLAAAASSGYGGGGCCPPVVDPYTLLALLVGVTLATYFLRVLITVTMVVIQHSFHQHSIIGVYRFNTDMFMFRGVLAPVLLLVSLIHVSPLSEVFHNAKLIPAQAQ